VDAPPIREIHHLDGVVFQTGDEQALRLGIHSEVIEPAFHALERHRTVLDQAWCASFSLCRGGLEKQKNEPKGHNNQPLFAGDG
jgi:hypothetical protein